jgi:hypothetical protein
VRKVLKAFKDMTEHKALLDLKAQQARKVFS